MLVLLDKYQQRHVVVLAVSDIGCQQMATESYSALLFTLF